MSRLASHFSELEVYVESLILADTIFKITKRFPRDEAYRLTDQLVRASRSIGAQIAEAWSRRRYRRHFSSKLADALGEQMETWHWIRVARNCGYLTDEQASDLLERTNAIGKLLNSMMQKSHLFCRADYPSP